MARNIVFCADGTWNGPQERTGISPADAFEDRGEVAREDTTNVLKLFASLGGQGTAASTALANEQEIILADTNGNVRQVAKYIHGVGDSSNVLIKLLGGTFGFGLIARIVRGYTFISRWYEPGDAIHIVGFSRGAYTARALAGMIAKVGLLNRAAYDPDDKDEAYRLGIAAWARAKGVQLNGAGRLNNIANAMLGFVQTVVGGTLPSNGLVPNVPVKSVAVWDTVGSLGIPAYVGDHRYDAFRFVDTALSDKVEFGFHAMSIDELRADFPVTRWDDRRNVTQVWFCGAHADVGGGYPKNESALSDITLDWMIRKLEGVGVVFVDPALRRLVAAEGYPEVHRPWEKFPFDKLLRSARSVGAHDRVHTSVPLRWNGAAPAYRPDALKAFRESGIGGLATDA
jgi:uncharacterized protein (DUF2235 family)